jgi:hypothetical protein
MEFPVSKSSILKLTDGKLTEGWELSYFLGQALSRRSYPDLRSIILDLDDWLEKQG